MAIRRRGWRQNSWWDGTQRRWRAADNLPPAAPCLSSPSDVDAHAARKDTTQGVGDKGHRTETCEEAAPHLITPVDTLRGPTADGAAPPKIHAALPQRGLLPGAQLVDTGVLEAALLVESRDD